MQIGDIIRITHTNGNKTNTTILALMDNEITGLNSSNHLVTINMNEVAKITRLSHCEVSRSDRHKIKRRNSPRTLINIEEAPKIQRKKQESSATLYIAGLGYNYYKIGYTRKPIDKRLKSLKTASISKIRILATQKFNHNNITSKEAQLKKHFAAKFTQSKGGTEVFRVPSEQNAVNEFHTFY